MTGASIETTLEPWASSLREVKALMRQRGTSCGIGEQLSGQFTG